MAQYDLITFNNKEYYDMIPDVIDWKGDEYEITASSSWSSKYSAWQIFDKEKSDIRWASNGISNQWIEIHLVNKVKINTIAMKSSNFFPETTSPKAFKIWGSNDGKEYTLLKTINDSKQWSSEEIRIYELNGTYKFSYLKITFDENWGDDEEIDFNELYYLLSKDCCHYLINDNGIYKNYNEETNSLVEVTDTSILNEDALNNICIYNLNKLKDIINLKQPGIKIVSNKKFKSTISSLKTNKQLIIANGDFSTRLAANIDYFKFNYDIPEGTIIKTVVSTNSGAAWYTYDGAWTRLDNTVPIKDYSELSSEEKIQWNTFLDEVLTKGINVQEVNTLDFNTLNSEKIRFAYAIQISDANVEAILKDLKWQFDSIGSYEQLNPKTDVNIKITNNDISITPLKNIELMKINVGISSQVPQVFDTSGLLDKETFKGKEINSVKLADKARSLEPNLSQIDGTRKYYGVDNNDGEMKLRTFPAGTHTEHVDTYVFDNLTKGVPQTVPFIKERPEVNVMPAVFKYREGLKNQEDILEKYSNDNINIRMRNKTVCVDDGIKIKDEYLKSFSQSSSENNFYQLDVQDFIDIDRIEVIE